ncbi:tetratricopeptide repeat protein [Taklimakanibacter deserti]|uniref:tetratricopeptide repeat protein n=1 Tax=Taklimakanibacter deserti TaxID=2267839 RepID=UPI0013C4A909
MSACGIYLSGAILIVLALSARASLADDRHDCEKLKGEASLRACSAVIEAGTHDAGTLAIAYLNRGLEYFDKGHYDQAINDYSASIDLAPMNADVYNNRGNAYQAKRDYGRAISDFDMALHLNPRHALAYNNRGIAYANRGEFDRAILSYDGAIAIDPAYAGAYNNRGYAYARKGAYDRAVDDFGTAIALDPGNAPAYRNRARVYQNLGRYDLAVADYRQALDIRPSESAAQGLKVSEALLAAKTKEIEEGAEAETATFRQMPNTDLTGPMIGKIAAGNLDQCEKACGKDQACNAYSFNMWNSVCFLKAEATLRFLDPSTVSGLKGETYPPPISNAMMAMLRFRNKAFPGDPVRASLQNRFEDCEASCEASEACIAFSFIKASSMCQIFEQAEEYVSDEGVDSGAKRQVVN